MIWYKRLQELKLGIHTIVEVICEKESWFVKSLDVYLGVMIYD